MEITEVRIKLIDEAGERLKAFCSVTFDGCFVVRDLKIIEGSNGPFVAMPSRKLTSHCQRCRTKNHLRAQYCNQCGTALSQDRAPTDSEGRAKLYADIAHPINSSCRELIQGHVIREYNEELERSTQPDYISRYDDFDSDYSDSRSSTSTSTSTATSTSTSTSASTAVRAVETRVDQAHQKQGAHAPHSGGAAQQQPTGGPPRPPSRSAPASPTVETEEGFGAGIFPNG